MNSWMYRIVKGRKVGICLHVIAVIRADEGSFIEKPVYVAELVTYELREVP